MIFVFADTNIWVHFRRLAEFNWPSVLGHRPVTFVATPTLVRELDKLKYASRTRDRARASLAQIETWATAGAPVELRDGVRGLFYFPTTGADDPQGLDLQNGDDALVATVIAFRAENLGAQVYLLSDDSGPRITARRVGIEPLTPPEEMREPARADSPEDVEIRRLRAEVSAMQNRMPRISLRLANGMADGSRLEVAKRSEKLDSESTYIARVVSEAKHRVPEMRPAEPPSIDISKPEAEQRPGLAEIARAFHFYQGSIAQSEFDRYASERTEFITEVERIARGNWLIQSEIASSILVEIQLVNQGSAPAIDVDVRVHIPDGPEVQPKPPEFIGMPAAPARPRSAHEMLFDNLHFQPPSLGPHFDSMNVADQIGARNVSPTRIRRTNSHEVTIHVERIKQHQELVVATFCLIFPTATGRHSLRLDYHLNSATLPRPVEGSLHIVVR
jgi:hypothetical protein